MQESMPPTPEAPPIGQGVAGPTTSGRAPLDDPRALQILSTEHWSLLATRSLSYNEAFSRAGMFLTFLSASLIVIGFLVGSNGLSADIIPVALVLLVADFFIGMATVGRLIDAGHEEFECIRGMNRIRHAYREMIPGIEPYFISGFHDDARGVLATYSSDAFASGFLANLTHGLTTTVGMVAVIDAMILGAIAGLVAVGVLGGAIPAALIAAVVGFLIGFATFSLVMMRAALGRQRQVPARFPTPEA